MDPDEEIRRVVPVIDYLAKKISIPISIDTTKSAVAERAIMQGHPSSTTSARFIFDPHMAAVAQKHDCLLILMHMKGTPRDMQVSTPL
ncbi:MAG: dihydropteroate synthase [Desulfobacterales bacterium]